MILSVNGILTNDKEAVVSVYDHGFLYGLGLFETFRTYKKEPFLLPEHLRRLTEGCRELGIGYEPDLGHIQRLIDELLKANHLEDAYIRYSVSAGVDILGLPSGVYQNPTEIIYIKPLPPRDEQIYTQGKALQLLKLPRNTPEGLYRFKSFHYMNNILAKRELLQYDWAAGAEGLMLTEEGYVAEGIVSNIFFIKDRICYTPSLDTGILPGITRAYVLQLAQQQQIPTQGGLYRWEDLMEADEVFIVNSIQEIVPITTLFTPSGQSHIVGEGVVGPITRQFSELYN
ncbi:MULTISPECIES: aminodeoxychorismate lyase [unclassified Paenibacillus]|uniref:aminodeoxychorismate lyase n=1 Tax=unclassified Paenibacillus TaxID=185978 RepID=UPI00070E312D|nr:MULTISPECIES: aminodeoxychorismate lyase [unclassified Paenibacillus]KQX57766.1 4-amino-4-deoxychorismate lyase [Paenibacillus sp. Root444D2]KRE45460.1 4-amino-4-deoxychorismate lyase [Paenibacillus sp. Soil724D2]